jgi:MtN3 and saliva related transmembrane protein
MEYVDTLGYVAAFCTTLSFLPQALKAIRYRDTKSLSLGMYVLLTVGVFLWLAYGVLKNDYAIMAANAVSGLLSLAILITKIRYDVWPSRGRGLG